MCNGCTDRGMHPTIHRCLYLRRSHKKFFVMRAFLPFAFSFLLMHIELHAQAPQRISYQAVVRDAAEALLTNTTVGMRISILQGSGSGPSQYTETHVSQSNSNGLVTFEIGAGTVVSGDLNGIDWADGPYFILSETDPDGGSDYSIAGTSQLLSVPYAFFAANSQAGPQGPQGPPGQSNCAVIRTGDGRAVVYTAGVAHGFGLSSTGGSQWYSTNLDGPVVGAVASDSSVVLYTASTAYGFALSSTGGSSWNNTTLSGTPVGALTASARIVVYTSNNAYGFGRSSTGSTAWSNTSLDAPALDHVVAGDRIVLYTPTMAYGYGLASTGGSQWYPTTLTGTPEGGQGTR